MKKILSILLQVIQWIFFAIGLLIALSMALNKAALSAVLMLLSALIVFPLLKFTPILKNVPALRNVLQFVIAFVLFMTSYMVMPGFWDEPTESLHDESSIVQTEPDTTESTKTSELTAVPTTEHVETVPHRAGEAFVGISDKEFSEDAMSILYSESVRNDATGNWRLARISAGIQMEEYALSYYQNYFTSDSEVHAIVDFGANTTTMITSMGSALSVRIYQYIEDEEHDAKVLGSGEKLAEYMVYTDNGDIEKIQ